MPQTAIENPASIGENPAHAARLSIRENGHSGHTAGMAPGYVQANLAILPAEYAQEFQTFCQLNPKPCPILAVGETGSPVLPTLGVDIDLRTDLSGYRVFENGVEIDTSEYWRDDLVAFPLGCSYSFEEALLQDGLPLRHIERNECVAMYVTNIDTKPAGRFSGKMVVSMRPMKPADAIRAIQITTRFPNVHGAPVHIGHPELIGVNDIEKPVFGGAPPLMKEDEIPVFWACGVTPQVVIEQAKPSFCITHRPGCMLVTDLKNSQLAIM
jgi:uncharacterized protein YcsI (UPF0317 family)